MTEAPEPGLVLLVGLMAAQFLVHAAGWAMAAMMQRQALGPEGHFSLFWLALACALAVLAAPWPAAPAARALADLMAIAGTLAMHRGILRFYRQDPPDRVYFTVAALTLTWTALSLQMAEGPRLREVWVSLVVSGASGATALAFWRNGRRRTRALATAVAALLSVAALGMLMRGGVALLEPRTAALGLDAEASLSSAYAIAFFFLAGLFNLAQIRLVLGRVLQRLVAQSQRDPLTGVANRRGFMVALDGVHRRALRSGAAYGVLMVDIDHFKRINDQHGHAAGDAALRDLAEQLSLVVRGGDIVGRLGGEEFCMLLPGCDLAGAESLAQRVCAAVAAAKALTVSIGVALVDAGAETADQALARADAALYCAKHQGRNRVVVG